MARSRGFEPLTAWFVARYSIQLSYERAENFSSCRPSNKRSQTVVIMARSRGFEPLTAWFVARYSIQLSYERAENFSNCRPPNKRSQTVVMMARSRGFEPLTAWFVARYSIQLSYERANWSYCLSARLTLDGALERIRTSDRLVRSQVLYPAELRARRFRAIKKSLPTSKPFLNHRFPGKSTLD